MWYTRPFDVYVWSEHKELNKVIDEVFNSFSDEQRLSIRGKGKNKGKATGRDHLRVVLLDLYVAWKTDPRLSIGVPLGNDAYKDNSRYIALFISPRVRDVIHCLHDEEFIDLANSSYNCTGAGNGNRTTRIRVAQMLVHIFNNIGLVSCELSVLSPENCATIFVSREGMKMARKRYSDEDALKLLRETTCICIMAWTL